MKKEDCFELGYVSKAHGYKGELLFLINEGLTVKINELEWVFIDINGQLIPFHIDDSRPTSSTSWIVRLNDVDTEEKARRFMKCKLYLLLTSLPSQTKKKLQPAALNGYMVIDDVKGEIGTVAKVLDMPQQLILEVHFENKEILIPANEDIIYKIDHKKKIIHLNAPEGLIDMYLNA